MVVDLLISLFEDGLLVDFPLLLVLLGERLLVDDLLLWYGALSPVLREEFLVDAGLRFSRFEDGLREDLPLARVVLSGERLPVDDSFL